MDAHETLPGQPESVPRTPPAQLTVVTDAAGRITSGGGRWPGADVYRAATLGELVHDHNHDLLERISSWVGNSGRLDHGVGVQVRTNDGWDEALVTAVGSPSGVQWRFVPVLPDPLRQVVRAVSSGRDIAIAIDSAVDGFAEAGSTAWATVHCQRDASERYRRVVATTGRDTFRRAVEALAAGDTPCPWDREFDEPSQATPLEAFGDGIRLAGPHAGIGSCCLVPIPSTTSGDAAVLAVWSETPEQLESPELHLLVSRVAAALELAFQVEAGVEGQRVLAIRDALTGLWNRQALFAQLSDLTDQQHGAVVIVDVDDFRAINDWHGYSGGDELLIALAERLRAAMRPGDVVARVSSDEFAVLCFDIREREAAEAIAARVLDFCDKPFRLSGAEVTCGLSIGLAMQARELTGLELFAAAERTMLEVKAEDRGTWRLA